MELLIGIFIGAVLATAVPFVHEYAGKARDWLYGLFRKGDDSDSAGA